MVEHETDSVGAVNVIVDVVAKNIVWPLDPNDPEFPRLLDVKRRLEEAKKKRRKKGRDQDQPG